MSESDWDVLEGIDPKTAQFPTRAKVGDEGIVIFRTERGFFGTQRTCPHQQASLTLAILQANGTMIRCSRHHYTFRTADGRPVNCPGFRLRIYEVKEEDGRLLVRRSPVP
jgi:nitrite reductase/ring-hydroxylating ferredoxin subunit